MLPPSDLHAPRPVIARAGERIHIMVIGAGGTGSQLAPHLARLVWDFNQQQEEEGVMRRRHASLLLVDPDYVTEKNVRARQNFCPAEIGFPKAQVLANRYAFAFGLQRNTIAADVQPFARELVYCCSADLVLLVGCVDTAEARATIAECLTLNHANSIPHLWYVDAGNGFHWGQVFVGSTATLADLQGCLHEPLCARLPSPALLAPSLFAAPEEVVPAASSTRRSCGDLVLSTQEGNRQSRTINTQMASLLYTYVEQLLYGSLTTFATYTNLATVETHSLPVTPGALGRALNLSPNFFTLHPADDAASDDEDGDELEG